MVTHLRGSSSSSTSLLILNRSYLVRQGIVDTVVAGGCDQKDSWARFPRRQDCVVVVLLSFAVASKKNLVEHDMPPKPEKPSKPLSGKADAQQPVSMILECRGSMGMRMSESKQRKNEEGEAQPAASQCIDLKESDLRPGQVSCQNTIVDFLQASMEKEIASVSEDKDARRFPLQDGMSDSGKGSPSGSSGILDVSSANEEEELAMSKEGNITLKGPSSPGRKVQQRDGVTPRWAEH
ncbi:hypothetical protein NDU88_006093 [Pleurodeles waltl]|uniref:Uncharacterized protein n=1 Tax=Pleurodeles waltl TaxID=8319 RepID=A0AAV7N329_PLEWA|nr:hypothetical protein NDU88_006093 [Pleurodeles waltl]